MIAKLLRFALQQRFITVLIGLTLIGAGIWAFQQLKIEAYPDISDTQVGGRSRSIPATPPRKWSSRSRCRSSAR